MAEIDKIIEFNNKLKAYQTALMTGAAQDANAPVMDDKDICDTAISQISSDAEGLVLSTAPTYLKNFEDLNNKYQSVIDFKLAESYGADNLHKPAIELGRS